ncbi:hypothetical protein ScPMuIL_003922 [Solemya velum]
MVEVCCAYSETLTFDKEEEGPEQMKHSNPNVEVFEYNLGKASQLRCTNVEGTTGCGDCETCDTAIRLRRIKELFPRLGDHSKKRLMLGIMRRLHSVDLLQQVVSLLQPLLCKDFIYSRSRTNPSLNTDTATLSSDRSLDAYVVEQYILDTWTWFQGTNYWSKANFALAMLQLCDAHLLHILCAQARTLLVSDEKAALTAPDDNYVEDSSITDSRQHSFHLEDHPELDLLSRASSQFRQASINPFTGIPFDTFNDSYNIEDDFESTTLSSLDPACMIVPTSSKAYSGVAKKRDFIRSLPVHLAKYVLSFLDQATLLNALCVSSNWRALVEEVHQEFFVSHQLREEVMLMQGASAQGANPVYAKDIDVLVPNINTATREVIYTNEGIIKPTFKSEVNFETAYSGVSVRKVIMEERNIYCGPYNVMVLCDNEDPFRNMHTDGGKLIALGSKDRKVRFIESESGKDKGPVITGHAGSIRCVYLMKKRGMILSGSYDTSVRCWNVETGQCLKIFRGHRDTVLTITVVGNTLASGSKDASCKIWQLETGKCVRTFRHRQPIPVVALSEDCCITGCEGGKVKVWDLLTGELIKKLNGHNGPVTCVKFDHWHIITGSKDGYALVWSTQGKHNRCLMALRHPKDVLCLEFLYLRVVTGSADGRLRIWNVITGQCCRIMRGNSRSDPVESILALGDRIFINTLVNLLVLNFEKVDWNYNLDNDRVPPLVQYGSYSDAPVRQQPYAYVRAQRMRRAGASNEKVVMSKHTPLHGEDRTILSQSSYRARQLSHSAKTLSTRSLSSARQIQSSVVSETLPQTPSIGMFVESRKSQTVSQMSAGLLSRGASSTKPPLPKSKSQASAIKVPPTVTIAEEKEEIPQVIEPKREMPVIKRRVSWAFDNPPIPKTKDLSLSETKSLLRSQMRIKSESAVPPDFVYLTVSAIQNSMMPSETNNNTYRNMKDIASKTLIRPSSSPSRIDPRTKVPVEELDLEDLFSGFDEAESISEFSELKSRSSKGAKSWKTKTLPDQFMAPDREVIKTKMEVKPVISTPTNSLQPKQVKSTLPKGRVIRPVSAAVGMKEPLSRLPLQGRPMTAPHGHGADMKNVFFKSIPQKQKPIGLSTSGFEVNMVPMLMYPANMKERLASLKERRQTNDDAVSTASSDAGIGAVSHFSNPFQSHKRFQLRTREQENNHITNMKKMYADQKKNEDLALEKERRAAWLAKATGKKLASCH